VLGVAKEEKKKKRSPQKTALLDPPKISGKKREPKGPSLHKKEKKKIQSVLFRWLRKRKGE